MALHLPHLRENLQVVLKLSLLFAQDLIRVIILLLANLTCSKLLLYRSLSAPVDSESFVPGGYLLADEKIAIVFAAVVTALTLSLVPLGHLIATLAFAFSCTVHRLSVKQNIVAVVITTVPIGVQRIDPFIRC